MTSKILAAASLGLCLLTGAHAAPEQAFPTKPIRLVVAYPPGGSTDILARIVGQKITELTGQPAVVDNKGGGNGIIGGQAVAGAAPDGYTLLVTGNGPHAINPAILKKIPYDSATAFAPIALLAKLPLVMVATPNAGINTPQDFIKYAKSEKGVKTFASIGNGTPSQLAMEVFKSRARIELTHVPYKGSGPALIAVMGGQEAPVLFDSVLSSLPHIQSGKVKAIGVSSAERLAQLPGVPTIAESGMPGFDIQSWTGMFAPAGTPPARVKQLSDLMEKVLNAPDVREKIQAQGGIVSNIGSRRFTEFSRSEIARWKKIVQAAGIQPE